MLININDIKNGMTVIVDGKLCVIVEFQHVKPGKGSPFVKIKLRNLRTGSITVETFNTNIVNYNHNKGFVLYIHLLNVTKILTWIIVAVAMRIHI